MFLYNLFMQNGKISGSLEGINQETGKEDVRTCPPFNPSLCTSKKFYLFLLKF